MTLFPADLRPFHKAAAASAIFLFSLILIDALFLHIIGYRGGILLLPVLGLVTLTVAVFSLMTFNDGANVSALRFTMTWFFALMINLVVVCAVVASMVVATMSRGIPVEISALICAIIGAIGQCLMMIAFFKLSARRIWVLHLVVASVVSMAVFLLAQKISFAGFAALASVAVTLFGIFRARALTDVLKTRI